MRESSSSSRRPCDHETAVRIEALPPAHQPGPYVRWFCNEPACNQEFNPILGPGPIETWFEVQKMRAKLHRDALLTIATVAIVVILIFRIL